MVKEPQPIQRIVLDSFLHYSTEERDGRIVLREHEDDACPHEQHRRHPHARHETRLDFSSGKEIASWRLDEEVEFVYLAGRGLVGTTDGVVCGDDFQHMITRRVD